MSFIEILLGQIPEALYFSLFMIYAKQLKEKRLLFVLLNIIEYILLMLVFPYSIWSHILYFGLCYVLLKILYKNKSQITDIFTLGIASIVLIFISFIASLLFRHNILLTIIFSRICILSIFIKNYLYKISKLYKKFWNRNDKPKKMKSTTFRAINTVIFNLMFYIINIGITYILIFEK